jgi:hypothetical protein
LKNARIYAEIGPFADLKTPYMQQPFAFSRMEIGGHLNTVIV